MHFFKLAHMRIKLRACKVWIWTRSFGAWRPCRLFDFFRAHWWRLWFKSKKFSLVVNIHCYCFMYYHYLLDLWSFYLSNWLLAFFLSIPWRPFQALVKAAYSSLGLQTYFTSGPTETKAWTIKKGMTAPQVLLSQLLTLVPNLDIMPLEMAVYHFT